MNETEEKTLNELTQLLDKHSKYWMGIVSDLNEKLRSLDTLTDLESEVFMRRQEASEYCTEYAIILAKKVYEYKVKFGDVSYKYKSSPENIMKMRTDSFITSQVERDLAFDKYVIDILDAHYKHMQSTVKSITDIVYAIQNRIRIEELSKGIYR